MIRKYAAILIALVLFFAAKTAVAIPRELHKFLNEHSVVRIYIELKNSSGNDKVDINLMKKFIEKAFENRKAYTFTIAKSTDEADMVLKGNIVEYVWAEVDPVDQVWGFGAAAMDAAASDNYARMQVDTQLLTSGGGVLWDERVQATVTRHVMPKDSSYEFVYHRFVKSLMTGIFKKRNR